MKRVASAKAKYLVLMIRSQVVLMQISCYEFNFIFGQDSKLHHKLLNLKTAREEGSFKQLWGIPVFHSMESAQKLQIELIIVSKQVTNHLQ
jgi:hypothetical protein